MKKIIAVFALLYSGISFAASIPPEYLGKWGEEGNCFNYYEFDKTGFVESFTYIENEPSIMKYKYRKVTKTKNGLDIDSIDEDDGTPGKPIHIGMNDKESIIVTTYYPKGVERTKYSKCTSYAPLDKLQKQMSLFGIKTDDTKESLISTGNYSCTDNFCHAVSNYPKISGNTLIPTVSINSEGKVTAVIATIKPNLYDIIYKALTEKYSEPLEEVNKNNITLAKWRFGKHHIILNKYGPTFQEGYIFYERVDQQRTDEKKSISEAKSIL